METNDQKVPDILIHPELHTGKGSPLGHKVFNFMRSHLQKKGYIPAKNDGLFDKLGQQYTRQQLTGRAAKFRRKSERSVEKKATITRFIWRKSTSWMKNRIPQYLIMTNLRRKPERRARISEKSLIYPRLLALFNPNKENKR